MWGLEGRVSHISGLEVTFWPDAGPKAGGVVSVNHTALADASSFQKPLKAINLSSVTRLEKQVVLVQAGFESETADEVQVVSQSTNEIIDQTVILGLELLKLNYAKQSRLWPPVSFLSPLLLRVRQRGPEENPSGDVKQIKEACLQAMKAQLQEKKLVLAPIWSSDHWVFLSVDMRGAEPVVKYYDTLTTESEKCRETASELLKELGLSQPLPDRANKVFQPPQSGLCGWYVLAYIELLLAEAGGEGPAARAFPSALALDCRGRMAAFTKALSLEQEKLKKDKQLDEEKRKAQELKEAKAKERAIARLSAAEKAAKLAEEAQAQLDANRSWGVHALSEDAKATIQRLQREGLGICSRCRWTHGCLSCSAPHAERYYLKTEHAAWAMKRMRAAEAAEAEVRAAEKKPPAAPPSEPPPS